MLENLPVNFVGLLALPLDHIASQGLGIHSAHAAEPSLSIIFPKWLANCLPFVYVFLRRWYWIIWSITAPLLVQSFEELLVGSATYRTRPIPAILTCATLKDARFPLRIMMGWQIGVVAQNSRAHLRVDIDVQRAQPDRTRLLAHFYQLLRDHIWRVTFTGG